MELGNQSQVEENSTTEFKIVITSSDLQRGSIDVAEYTHVPVELAEGINSMLNKFHENGKVPATYKTTIISEV